MKKKYTCLYANDKIKYTKSRTFRVQLGVRVKTKVVDERLGPIRRARRTVAGEMGFQVREVQRRIAGIARAVLDSRPDRTPGLRHLGPSEIRGRWLRRK